MSSGVGVNPQCIEVFQALKLKKEHQYIIYKLNDNNTEIIVDKTSKEQDYDAFLGDLPEDCPRWAVYDFAFEKEDGGKRNKITFFAWSPDGARIKHKMVYSSSKDALRRALVGVAVDIQGTDFSEVAHESVLEKASKGA